MIPLPRTWLLTSAMLLGIAVGVLGATAALTVDHARMRPDVAIVFARAHVQWLEGNEPREIETRPTLIVVKEQARWQIVAFQNTKISEGPAAAQAAARLAT